MNWLDVLARVFDSQYQLVGIVLVLVALVAFRRKEVFLVSLLAVYLLTPVVKDVYGVERPCNGASPCPDSFGFPSGHAGLAFVFAAASIGTLASFFFVPFALLVSYTRIYLGVHTLDQVAGGAALAFVVYFIVEWLFGILREKFGIKVFSKVFPRVSGA